MSVPPSSRHFTDIDYYPSNRGAGTAPTPLCKGCDDDVEHDSGYCDQCRVCCPICEDWLAGEPEMYDALGNRVHISCVANEVMRMLEDTKEEFRGNSTIDAQLQREKFRT